VAGYYPIKVEVEGRAVAAEWTLLMGGRICVRCQPYGRLIVPVGRRNPVEWSKRVAEIIVLCWLKRQETHRARQEAEAKRLGQWGRRTLASLT
jgi:hypothetical protein